VLTAERGLRASIALKNLPPFPLVAAKVADLLTNELSSFETVAETLKTDAALCAEVLKLANSPLVSVRYNVTNVTQALALLGSRRVVTLIMTLGLSKLIKRTRSSEAMRRLWRHNLACALAARHLAELSRTDSNQAYYAGLFHDIGRLALLAQKPALYDQAIERGEDIDEMERRNFGIDHTEAGVWVVDKWKLPKAFTEVVLEHHHPPKDASDLTLLVCLACQTADRLGFSLMRVSGDGELGPTDEIGFSIALAVNQLETEYGI
jgi:putative nucleotidyltransferase with HDIG domain